MASDDVMSACMDGNHKLLKTQLALLHLDANEADDEGVTPLYVASGTRDFRDPALMRYYDWENIFWIYFFLVLVFAANISPVASTSFFKGVGSVECVKLLLEFGAKLNARDANGISPLYMAAQEGRDEVVKVFIINPLFVLLFIL